jgi:ADP-ribosyl-[dinitrogen reductase] hydrolase
MDRRKRVLGALYGHLVGDAFGVPFESFPPSALPAELRWGDRGAADQPQGTWSDDGAMMLCQVASLLETGRFDPEDTARRFVRWAGEGYMAADGEVFSIGMTTAGALNRFDRGVPALGAGGTDEQDNGNGALMRILPLGLWYATAKPAELIAVSQDASRITHGHLRSQVCCALHNLLVAGLLAGDEPAGSLRAARGVLAEFAHGSSGSPAYGSELESMFAYPARTGSGYVVDCLWSAWDALTSAGSYVETVRRAVAYGHDTDTTAAVAGGLAGALYGLDQVPSQWRTDLRLDLSQRQMLDRFADAVPFSRKMA